jgi:hypothetical protein
MKYMLIMAEEEALRADREGGDCRVDGTETAAHLERWLDEMGPRGVLRDGDRIESVTQATTVRVRSGETLVADGPFAETKEQMAGYNVIECADLDEAIEIASKHPCAHFGSVEIRPLFVWE